MQYKRSMFRFFATTCTLVVAIGAACAQSARAQSGAVYYVSTAGSDGNPGTSGKPWRHIQYAANQVSAGATVYVFGGVYTEAVSFPRSGMASAPITFESYPGQTAILDGKNLLCCGPSGTEGLFTIAGSRSYITISGFEVRNLTTSRRGPTPAGIWVTGSGTGVQILNNVVHDITTTAARGNAFGISVYGTSKTPLTQIVISGNSVYDLLTGQSESVNVDGNVTHYRITNNLVHDNDNIGIAAIGYDNAGPVGYDEAMYGEISGNTVYNISGITNKGEGQSYDADGIYCDGCAYVTIENNWVFNADLGIEVTSENQFCQPNGTEWTGPSGSGSPGKSKYPCYGRYATVRNNVFSNSENAGLSIGGAAAATARGGSETLGGSTLATAFVNNTIYNDVKQTQNNRQSAPGGEIQIQHQIGSAQGDYFENNLVYAGSWNHWIYSFVKSTPTYPAPPATTDCNLYYLGRGVRRARVDRLGPRQRLRHLRGVPERHGRRPRLARRREPAGRQRVVDPDGPRHRLVVAGRQRGRHEPAVQRRLVRPERQLAKLDLRRDGLPRQPPDERLAHQHRRVRGHRDREQLGERQPDVGAAHDTGRAVDDAARDGDRVTRRRRRAERDRAVHAGLAGARHPAARAGRREPIGGEPTGRAVRSSTPGATRSSRSTPATRLRSAAARPRRRRAAARRCRSTRAPSRRR